MIPTLPNSGLICPHFFALPAMTRHDNAILSVGGGHAMRSLRQGFDGADGDDRQ